ncbi:hypothetical protein AVEN_127272-1 [Araneus ventricosus]|uniref:Chitin-binding type-2 domain-containing protein n=1 Tax=Araneus ventricosus TaxID=182803 RepID=A0A4Y2N1B9_ARAVE|nr:hypothetical protein AVEN_127272-1 [Araneus ventricosus]
MKLPFKFISVPIKIPKMNSSSALVILLAVLMVAAVDAQTPCGHNSCSSSQYCFLFNCYNYLGKGGNCTFGRCAPGLQCRFVNLVKTCV